MPEVLLYAGPSAWGIDAGLIDTAGVRLCPPVRRGDIDRLLDVPGPPGVIVVCDGVFQIAPAVSHAELCRAIDAGWQAWGASSIGAIRAHELRDEGMRGYGEVFAMFERFDDFTDDEMCLLHFPESPYFPVSEALVNLRYALERHGAAVGISEAQGHALIDALGVIWFGDRTEARIRALMKSVGIDCRAGDSLMDWLARHRVKTLDLLHLLEARPWCERDVGAQTP